MTYRPNVDGALLTQSPLATIQAGVTHSPLASYPTLFDALIALTSDVGLTGSRINARAVAASQTEPVRRAYFSRGINSSTFPPGAFHGVDLAFLFHSFAAFGDNSPDAAEISLSDATIGYWTRFAATGDPNGSGAVSWPLYDAVTDPYLEFASPIVSGVGLHTANCDYWESVLSP